jgi:uncharacterized membrane protein YphA (DoxX/SURF4 family)
MFILSGYSKLQDIKGNAKFLQNKVKLDLPFNIYIIAILVVIFLQIVGSQMILYSAYTNKNTQRAYYSSIALAGFTVLATLIFHMPPTGDNYYTVTRNVSITGALLLLADRFKY